MLRRSNADTTFTMELKSSGWSLARVESALSNSLSKRFTPSSKRPAIHTFFHAQFIDTYPGYIYIYLLLLLSTSFFHILYHFLYIYISSLTFPYCILYISLTYIYPLYLSLNLLQAEGEPEFKFGGSFTSAGDAAKRQEAEIKMVKDLGPTTETKYGQAG